MENPWVILAQDDRDMGVAFALDARTRLVYTVGQRHPHLPALDSLDQVGSGWNLVGPMAGIGRGGLVNTAQGTEWVTRQVLANMGPGGFLTAGLIDLEVLHWAEEAGVYRFEYRKDAGFSWMNAIPTAEAAIQLAEGVGGRTLWGRQVAVLGFGRVGSVLSLKLKAMDTAVRTLDASRVARARAQALGIAAYPLDPNALAMVDVAFNTIPAPVLRKIWFEHSSAYIFDLASFPGGLDPECQGLPWILERYTPALGLPGKLAPVTAAELLAEVLVEVRDKEMPAG